MLCAGGFVRRSSNMSILKAVRGPALASWGLRAFAYGASDLSSCLRYIYGPGARPTSCLYVVLYRAIFYGLAGVLVISTSQDTLTALCKYLIG